MVWFPIGPDFVRAPRIANFQRISRRNLWGAQGRINHIAFETAAGEQPEYIYIVVTDASGQCGAFRKHRAEKSWTTIIDSLRSVDSNIDPRCTAVNPNQPETIFVGTWNDRGIYISNNRGEPGSWLPKITIDGRIRKIVVDPRPVSDPSNTVVYAATDNGIFRSADNGRSWLPILSGDVWSFCFRVSRTGGLHFYAGVYRSGIWYADREPLNSSAWTNLNEAGIGLPAFERETGTRPANFNTILLDCCPANPTCAYAWFTAPQSAGSDHPSHTIALYRTTSPRTAWTVASAPPVMTWREETYALNPYQGFTNYVFAAAPNSPGDGATDILFFGELGNSRSIDGGVTWQPVRQFFHADIHSYAFYPENFVRGVVPAFYVGCDGGLGINTRLADRTFPAESDLTDDQNNADVNLFPNSGVFINENAGLPNNLVYVLSGDPDGVAHPYIGCVDTSLAVRDGGLGWRGFDNGSGDSFQLAVALGTDGVKVWQKFHGGDRKLMDVGTDQGGFNLAGRTIVKLITEIESWISPESNFVLDAPNRCLAGASVEETLTTTTAEITPGEDVIVPVVSTAGITNGTYLAIGIPPNRQAATAQDVTPTSFRITRLYRAKPAGSAIRPIKSCVVRVNQDGNARRISQFFGAAAGRVNAIAANRIPPGVFACATIYQNLYRVDGALTETGIPDWQEITEGKPLDVDITSLAVTPAGDVFVLLVTPVPAGRGPGLGETPLFKISAGSNVWDPQRCRSLPTTLLSDGSPQPFGKLLVDPVVANRLYASHGAQVYSLDLDTSAPPDTWVWMPVATGLPGSWITDLWIGNIAPAGSRTNKVILRAGVIGRGVWETDVTTKDRPREIDLYLRRHLLDQGWISQLQDGLLNPYEPSLRVWHYQCADIKIDVPQISSPGIFYQTDPEASGVPFSTAGTPPGPISNCEFDQLKDNSGEIPEGSRVRVHVQVQNRSNARLNGVHLWVLFTSAAAGVPALDSTTTPGVTFPFWSQFRPDGTIVSALPRESRWKAIGPPVVLDGIDVNHPMVASWNWDVPMISASDLGHYCMAAFVHAPGTLIDETSSMSVDEITLRNKQVGQKNLHIVQAGVEDGREEISMEFDITFHNPEKITRQSTLFFDFRNLPAHIAVSILFSRLRTARPVTDSVRGVHAITPPSLPLRFLDLLIRSIPFARLIRRGTLFDRTRYLVSVSTPVYVEGAVLAPYDFCVARVRLTASPPLKPDEEYNIEVQQLIGDKLVGGSTFLIRGPSTREAVKPAGPTQQEFGDIEQASAKDPFRYLPPWIAYLRKKNKA